MSGAGLQSEARPFDPAREEAALLERCRELCERAADQGADQAEVYGTRSESIAVRFEKGDMKLTQVDEGTSLGLRVFREKRLGFSSTNQVAPEALAQTAEDAATLARVSPPDDANRLPATRPPAPGLSLVHADVAGLGVERAVELGRELVDRVRAVDPRISLDQAEVSVHRTTHGLWNTIGARAAESDAQLGFFVFGMAIDGEDVGGFHYCGDALRSLDAVEPALARSTAEFTQVALGNLDAQAAESYRGPVLFAPDAFLEVFVSPLLSAASAVAVQRGRSALAEKLGHPVAAPLLSIHDDPADETLAGAGSFDREGQPAVRFSIVEGGVLQSFLFNGYAAAVEGRESTGHALGGARNVPGLGPHAVSVAAGEGGDAEQMTSQLGRGLLVRRFSGSVDPASGDFSGVAKSARWVEGGRVVRPVKETLLSGNAFDLLCQLGSLSTTRERLFGQSLAPWAIVDGVSVTAG